MLHLPDPAFFESDHCAVFFKLRPVGGEGAEVLKVKGKKVKVDGDGEGEGARDTGAAAATVDIKAEKVQESDRSSTP